VTPRQREVYEQMQAGQYYNPLELGTNRNTMESLAKLKLVKRKQIVTPQGSGLKQWSGHLYRRSN